MTAVAGQLFMWRREWKCLQTCESWQRTEWGSTSLAKPHWRLRQATTVSLRLDLLQVCVNWTFYWSTMNWVHSRFSFESILNGDTQWKNDLKQILSFSRKTAEITFFLPFTPAPSYSRDVSSVTQLQLRKMCCHLQVERDITPTEPPVVVVAWHYT